MVEVEHKARTYSFDANGNVYQDFSATTCDLDEVRYQGACQFLSDENLKKSLSKGQRNHMVALRELPPQKGG